MIFQNDVGMLFSQRNCDALLVNEVAIAKIR